MSDGLGVTGAQLFSGLRAFVAAASRGLGRAVALELTGRGAHVAVNGTGVEGVGATAAETEAGRAAACPADLAGPGGPEAALARAGAFTTPDGDWQAGLDLVLLGAVRLIRAALAHLTASPTGRIEAAISSSARQPLENLTLSNVRRPALAARVRDLSLGLAPRGVLVTRPTPGRFDTDGACARDRARAGPAGLAPEAYRPDVEAALPAGQTLLVDGGLVRAL